MARRAMLVLLLAVLAPIGTASSGPHATSSNAAFYVVRPDPRACPSPLCGGYWIALANHARTRCHDGLVRARCYAATAVARDGSPWTGALPEGALARATIEASEHPGFGPLGVLVVERAFSPVDAGRPAGRFFRVVDTGVRCVRAPCFSLRASQLNRSAAARLSGLDTVAPVSERLVLRVERALITKAGVLAQGSIAATPAGGRALLATRFFFGPQR